MLKELSSGEGVGDGPLRSFWAALVELITGSHHWQATREDGHYVPLIASTVPPSEEDLTAFRAYGLVLRTGLIWGMELLPFSPAVVHFMVSSYKNATSNIYMNAVAPSTTRRINTWPTSTIHMGHDPYNIILELDSNVRVSFLPFFFVMAHLWHVFRFRNLRT